MYTFNTHIINFINHNIVKYITVRHNNFSATSIHHKNIHHNISTHNNINSSQHRYWKNASYYSFYFYKIQFITLAFQCFKRCIKPSPETQVMNIQSFARVVVNSVVTGYPNSGNRLHPLKTANTHHCFIMYQGTHKLVTDYMHTRITILLCFCVRDSFQHISKTPHLLFQPSSITYH